MGDTTNFDLSQTSFLFSWLSNSAVNTTGQAQYLADQVWSLTFDPNQQNSLVSVVGDNLYGGKDWMAAWGPGVFQNTFSNVADNTAFVAYNESEDIYIIGIAGTNPKSNFALQIEDLKVDQTVPWPYDPTSEDSTVSDGSTGAISYGTAVGLGAVLMGLTLSSHAQNTSDATLGDYLLSKDFVVSANTRIIFAGHSLGGALAPTLANWLLYKKPEYSGNISSLIVAGPTVGDSTYQENWDNNFQPNPNDHNVRDFNTNIKCNQDVVPHAWTRIFNPLPANDDDCYFSSVQVGALDNLNSKMGKINTCRNLYEDLVLLQAEGTAEGYKETENAYSYDADFPLSYYYEKAGLRTLGTIAGPFTDPIVTIDDFYDYKNALASIHIWSYGQDAFNIDLSVFDQLGFV